MMAKAVSVSIFSLIVFQIQIWIKIYKEIQTKMQGIIRDRFGNFCLLLILKDWNYQILNLHFVIIKKILNLCWCIAINTNLCFIRLFHFLTIRESGRNFQGGRGTNLGFTFPGSPWKWENEKATRFSRFSRFS